MKLDADARVPVADLQDEVDAIVDGGKEVVTRLVDLLLVQSVYNRGSDIHWETFGDAMRVRYRIDGVFRVVALIDLALHEQIIARLKVLANLLPHRRDIPQEGRLSAATEDLVDEEGNPIDLDFRLSVIPTINGEKAVVRIFDPGKALYDLNELGISDRNRKPLEEMLLNLRGVIVVTGPSSAGKTTTLYTALRFIHERRGEFACIVSIEDPVEYDLDFVAQMEVNRRLELDFAAGLRSFLRQDPEVIMVGEIRDLETCEIAMRAGLTGHCVLTTIHSGSTTEVLTRLLDMGVEPFIVSSAVTGSVAQRLVRTVCPDCQADYEPAPYFTEMLAGQVDLEGIQFRRGTGCARCDGTGYYGRTLITELMSMSEGMQRAILEKKSTATLRHELRAAGGVTLLEDGLSLVRAGRTTVEEVVRVLGTTRGGA